MESMAVILVSLLVEIVPVSSFATTVANLEERVLLPLRERRESSHDGLTERLPMARQKGHATR
jgi:hypothetical protein